MRKLHRMTAWLLLLLLCLQGTVPVQAADMPLLIVTASTDTEEEQLYLAAVEDAITTEDEELYPLVTLTKDDARVTWNETGDRVLLLSWHRYPDSYIPGENAVMQWGEVWTFADGEILDWYQAESKETVSDWTLRLEQLIGLPPEAGYTHVSGFWVKRADVVRPAYVTDVTAQMENDEAFLEDGAFREWFDGNVQYSYYESAYPWTRLGYTYDWADNGKEYGLTEFLILKGSEVEVAFTDTTEDFLARLADGGYGDRRKAELPSVTCLLSAKRGDDAFIDSAYSGVEKLTATYGLPVQTVECDEKETNFEEALREAAAEAEIVIAVGWQFYVVSNIAAEFPETKFIVMDVALTEVPDNVVCVTYAQSEGGFVAGYLAAACSQTGRVGAVVGASAEAAEDFYVGYQQGAQYYDAETTVLCETIESFADEALGKEAAHSLIGQGCDVLFQVCGASGLGVFQAAAEAGCYAIGADTDQKHLMEDVILCSVIKEVGVSLFDVMSEYLSSGVWKGGTEWRGGFESGYIRIGYGDAETGAAVQLQPVGAGACIAAWLREEAEALEAEIISGELVVESCLTPVNVKNEVITIYHTNDVHGRIDTQFAGSYDMPLGIASIAAAVKQTENAILVDAGDAIHGTPVAVLTQGEAVISMMNRAGYAFMAIGNHEFNYSADRLLALKELADFPIAAANIVETATGAHPFDEILIQELAGVKLGFFALTTEKTGVSTMPSNVTGYAFESVVAAAQRKVDELRAHGAEIIIAVGHLGEFDEKLTPEEAALAYGSVSLLTRVDGIDVLIDGHSHLAYEEGRMVGDTLVASAGQYETYLGCVELVVRDGRVVSKNARLLDAEDIAAIELSDEAQTLKTEIQTELDALVQTFTQLLNEPIGESGIALSAERAPGVRTEQTDLGWLVAESYRAAFDADLGFANGGDVRADLKEGALTYGDVLQILPFLNALQLKEVTPAQLKAVLENGLSKIVADENGVIDVEASVAGRFPQVAGFSYTYDPTRAIGDRVTRMVLDDGTELSLTDTETKLTFAASEYVLSGGDEYEVLAELPVLSEYGYTAEQALAEYLATNEVNAALVAEGNANRMTLVSEETLYVVQAQDYLRKIAELLLGDERAWTWIYERNKETIANPDMIYIGQTLVIPAAGYGE